MVSGNIHMDKTPLMHSVFEVSFSEINEFIDLNLEKEKKYQGFEINYKGRKENTFFWYQPESSVFFEMDKKTDYLSFHDYYPHDTEKTEVKISYEFHPMLGFIYDHLAEKIYKTFTILDMPCFLEKDTEKDLFQEYLNQYTYYFNAFRHEKNFDIEDPINLSKVMRSDPKKRKGRKSEYSSKERYEAVKAYMNIPKNAGMTLAKFLEERFGFNTDGTLKVPESTFYTWKRNFERR